MPLVSMYPLLRAARREGYAIGAFNPVDYASTKAVITAAESLGAPVIVQTSVKTVNYHGHATLAGWMNELGGAADVPVAFHLDHCHEPDFIQQCLDAGWTNVMIDASKLPYEENLALSKRVADMARPYGVTIEAELGKISGVEEHIVVAEADAVLADPDEAIAFCEAVDMAVFAPAIGTAHGIYKGEPKVAFDRLEEIGRCTDMPLALHGGTGLEDDVIQRCIQLGCAKVNISTNLKHAFIDGFVDHKTAHPDDYEPLRYLKAQFEAMRTMIESKIRQFGGAGKAKGLLAEVGA